MISIAEAISDLLFVRDTVVVPGLGAFVKKPVSAKVNPVANYFTKPSCQIEYDPNLREDNDLVVNYIAEKNEIPEDEARRLLMMFVSDCFSSLKSGNKVVLSGIGSLSHDWAGDLVFKQNKSANHNADAFGLCDFSPVSIATSRSKDDIKAEIARQQKDKNTPMTVDEEAVHKDDKNHKGRLGWFYILLIATILLGIAYALDRFKVVDLGLTRPRPEKVERIEPWKIRLPSQANKRKTDVPAATVSDTVTPTDTVALATPPVENIAKPEPSKPEAIKPETVRPEANIRIIAGCFAQEDNAARLANSLKDKGYPNAFYEQRGSKWYVAFGRYATDEEATAALRDIRSKGDAKAWILK